MGFEEDMAAPAPKAKSRKKIILAIIAVAIIAVVITPIALAGSYRVPIEIMSFDDTTGTTTTSPSLRLTSQVVTAWEYYFSIRTQGMVRTSDSTVSSSGGTTNITLTMTLTNPSNQTIDLGQTNISGGIGTRTHTISLSIDQGVHANGSYKFDVKFTANVVLFGGVVELPFSTTLHSNFVISGF
ncbi:MAG: hypothetical protein AUF79_06310 [Crenarchaeota archaeon 13_1_20CM_2_51_8]|nr:MAG: hypothetical protein AUF79_06310 [Crenarchaeota archaeon 13_1_20CM_2_51_8]